MACPNGHDARNAIGRCFICGEAHDDRTEAELAAGIECGADAAPKTKKSKKKGKK